MRARMIEAAGVQPDAPRAEAPGPLDRIGQQVPAEPAAGELRQQAEVDDLDRAVGLLAQLEVAGRPAVDRRAATARRPDRRDRRRSSSSVHAQPVGPAVSSSDFRVEPAARAPDRDASCALDLDAIARARRVACSADRFRHLEIGVDVPAAVVDPRPLVCARASASSAAPTRTPASMRLPAVRVRLQRLQQRSEVVDRRRRSWRRWSRRRRARCLAGWRPAAWCRAGPVPASGRPSSPASLADDVHQGADGELRQVAEVGEEPVVRFRRHRLRRGAERGDERLEPSRCPPPRCLRRRQDPGPAAKRSARADVEAGGGGAGERMAADEAQTRRQRGARHSTIAPLVLPTSVTSAFAGERVRRADSARAMFWRTGAARTTGRRLRRARGPRRRRSAALSRSAASMTSARSIATIGRPASAARTASAIDPPIRPKPTMAILANINRADATLSVAPAAPRHRLEADAAADRRRDDAQLGHQAIELRREQRLRAVALARGRDRCGPR